MTNYAMTMGGAGTGGGSAGYGGFGQPPQDDFYANRLKKLLTDPNAFQKTPGFQAALDTGRQAIERSAAARGMGSSGNVLAELMKYGTGLASQEYGNQVNRLSGLAGREDQSNFAWDKYGRDAFNTERAYADANPNKRKLPWQNGFGGL